MTDTARRLATIETITEIHPIDGADAIERARIRGWDVVVKKGEYVPGYRCVYFELDSFLDTADPRFAFLAPRGERTDMDGRKGHALKTARLRGVYSQGLALPVADFPEIDRDAAPGTDVTDVIGVTKWDPPLPAELVGQVRGRIPGWIPVTDEERLQNIPGILGCTAEWTATEKLDGASTTIYIDPTADPHWGVCSRNLDLLHSPSNTLWRMATEQVGRHGALELLERLFPGVQVALQGETYGAGIQGNPLKLKDQRFAAFTLRVDRREVPRTEWPAEILALSVPVVDLPFPSDLEQALKDVDGLKSQVSPGRAAEGVVWRASDVTAVTLPDGRLTRASFKVIGNHYLMKHDR